MNAWKLLPACLLLTTAVSAQDARTELQQLQGVWSGTLVHTAGKEPTQEERGLKIKLVIAGETYKAYAEDELLMEGTLRLDPAQQPRAIDAVFSGGDLKGMVQKGVYDLKPGEFIVNFAKPGDPRPRAFQTQPGSDEATVRYVREK
jgi:uncharacterized protein (TIGR03067 family)